MAMLTNDEISAEALDQLECELGPAAHTTRKYEALFGPEPGKSNKGATYRIRKPPLYDVNEGWVANYQSIDDDYVDLTIDKPRSVDIEITDEEMHLSLTDFKTQVLQPAMSALAHKVNLEVMQLYKRVWNYVGVPETATSASADYLQVGTLMDNNCAPRDGSRAVFLNSRTHSAAVEANKALQNPQNPLGAAFRKGQYAKDILGLDWHMTQIVANHLSGANTGAMLIDGANQTGASLVLDDGTALGAGFKAGDILDLTGYYDVNPVTKERVVGYPRRVVVGSDVTIDATGDNTIVPIYPTLVSAGKTQNVTGALSDAEAVLLFGHGSNYVSKTFPQGMAWPKAAIALAFCELKVPSGMDQASTKTDKEYGISVRFSKRWDQDTSTWKVRFQIFFGLALLRPEWVVRIFG